MAITTLPPSQKNWRSAELIGVFESNSEEWHELRSGSNVGGSEVSSIVGCNPWQSALSLWATKTGRVKDVFVPNESMEWGTRLESVILQKFADVHPELTVYASPGTFRSIEREWQIANPDALAMDLETGQDYVIEIKTARYEDDWVNGVPAYYMTQVQWYLQTFGIRKAYVAVLFSGSRYREFEIDADDFDQAVNLNMALRFRADVINGTQPDYDGSDSTYQTVRKLHPLIDDSDVELGDLGTYYVLAVAEAEKANEHLNEMKSRVLDAMGLAKRGLVDDKVVVARQAKAGGSPFLVNKR